MNVFVNYWKGFKRRWHIQSDWQVAVILTVFAITGTTTMYINRLIDEWLGLTDGNGFWMEFLLFMVLVLPLYNILLLIYGTLLGQYKFFRFFIVKFFSNIFRVFQFWKHLKIRKKEEISS